MGVIKLMCTALTLCALSACASANAAEQDAGTEPKRPAASAAPQPAAPAPMFPDSGLMGVCHGSIEQLKELNAHWIRYQIRWGRAEVERRGNYDFAAGVEQVKKLRAEGIHVLCLLTVEHLNKLYENDKENKDVIIEAAARFMEAAAIAFKGIDGMIFELSNEPECFPMGGYWNNPVIYTRFARRAAGLMKAADPDCKVATAGVAWMDKGFLMKSFEEGILTDGTIDAISFHGYHRADLMPESGLKEDVAWLRSQIERFKPKGKRVIVIDTERGYHIENRFLAPKHKDSWRNIVYTESEQAAYLARHYLTEAAAGIEIACWYVIGPHDAFGLYTYRHKGLGPSGHVFRNLASLLDSSPKLMGGAMQSVTIQVEKAEHDPLADKCVVETFLLQGDDGKKLVIAAWYQVEAFSGNILHWRDRIDAHYYEAWRAISPKDVIELPVGLVIGKLAEHPKAVYRWDIEAGKTSECHKEAETAACEGGLTIKKVLLRPMPVVYVVELAP